MPTERPKRISAARRKAAFKALAEHVARVGPHSWEPVRRQFEDIPHATWFRLVKRVKTEKPEPPSLKRARRQIAKLTPDEVVERAAAHLPRAPAPEYIARGGAQARADFDFLSKAREVYADAELLREHSSRVEVGEDGEERRKIVLPKSFAASITQRTNLISELLKIMARAYEYERIREFYWAIMEEIRAESPEMAARVAARLEVQNQRQGFSYAPVGGRRAD
jgi:hypothetical protein